jgi:hypothetical protein
MILQEWEQGIQEDADHHRDSDVSGRVGGVRPGGGGDVSLAGRG